MARGILENTELDSEDSIISLDVKSLYTNVPLKEAVEIALKPSGNISQDYEKTTEFGSE